MVFLEEPFRIVVGVDVYLGERVVRGRLVASLVDARLEPRQKKLQAITLLHLELFGRVTFLLQIRP